MPELPDVEAATAWLDARLQAHTVVSTHLASFAALKTVTPPLTALHGRVVTAVSRLGKHPLLSVEGPLYLVTHLSRGGWLHTSDTVPTRPLNPRGPVALRLNLGEAGALDITEHGRDHRLALHVVADPTQVPSVARLGPDALVAARDPSLLRARFMTTPRAHLKTAITDQTVVAGVGNAYSDEILHRARLSPFKPPASLTDEEWQSLSLATTEVLTAAIAALSAVPLADMKQAKRDSLHIHDHAGSPCPVCRDELRLVDLGSRSIEYCPQCQTGGRIMADRRLSRLLR